MAVTSHWKILLISAATVLGIEARAEDCHLAKLAPDWTAVRHQLSLIQTRPPSAHINIACVEEIFQRPDVPAPVKLICMEVLLDAGDAQQQKAALQWALDTRSSGKPFAEVEFAGGWRPDRPAVAVFSWLDGLDPAHWQEMSPELEALLEDVASQPLNAGPPHEASLVFSVLAQYPGAAQTRSSLIRSAIQARPRVTMFGYPGPEWLLPDDIQSLRRTLSESPLTLQSFHDAAASALCLLGDEQAIEYLSRSADRVRASDPWLADTLANRVEAASGMRSPVAFVIYLQTLSGSCAGVAEPLLRFAAARFGAQALADAGVAAALEHVRQAETADVHRLAASPESSASAALILSARLAPLKETAVQLGLLDKHKWPEILAPHGSSMP